MNYSILTEVTSDLPLSYINENKIGLLPTNSIVEGCEYDGIEKVMDIKEFYDKLRNAVMVKTSQNSPEVIKEHYLQYLEKGIDILHISFSSALSGNYQ
ncbi:MAG: DegV family protein, partial [Oscillospiraceae bacterium]